MWVGLTVAWLLLIHRTAEMKEAAHTGHWAELLQTVRQRVEWRWVGRVSRASDCAEQGVYCLDFVDSPSDSVVRGHEPCGERWQGAQSSASVVHVWCARLYERRGHSVGDHGPRPTSLPRRMTFWAGVPTTHAASTTDTIPIGVGLIAKGPNHEPNVVDCWGDRVIFEL
jgi:hypothetical protein